MFIKKTNSNSFNLTASNFIKIKIVKLLEKKEKINIALAGGNTPLPILKSLAKENLKWNKISFYQTDERIVPKDDNRSNFYNLSKVFFDLIESNTYPMYSDEQTPENSCINYINALDKLDKYQDIPRFDLIVLGMGEDGHIASLFPESPLLKEKNIFVLLDPIKRMGTLRMTLNFPVINNASETILLLSGSKKVELLESKKAHKNLPIDQLIQNNKNLTVICTED